MGTDGCQHIVDAIDTAVRERVPVIGLWHSGGARLAEGVEALDAVGLVFAAMVRASGRVPQISVVLGPAAGGAAYGPALTDLVIMSTGGRVFVTGPDVVRTVTGENVDMESLGGADTHGRRSGVVHIITDTDDEAIEVGPHDGVAARAIRAASTSTRSARTTTCGACCRTAPSAPTTCTRWSPALLDDGTFLELHAKWAPNIVTGLGRLTGRTVGVIANNPLRLGGCLDSPSAEKAARFVRMCDAFGVPLVVLVDVPGYLPGVGQEWDGVVRRGAKLLHAFAEAVVPRVTLVTRKAYGGAYIAMNPRRSGRTRSSPGRAPRSPSWARRPRSASCTARSSPRPRRASARRCTRSWPRSTSRSPAASAGRWRSASSTRSSSRPRPARALAEALAAAPAGRGAHGNIPL